MIWSIDMDDTNNTLLDVVADTISRTQSNFSDKDEPYRCSPIKDKRWWTLEVGFQINFIINVEGRRRISWDVRKKCSFD
jgi:hypothetical protein